MKKNQHKILNLNIKLKKNKIEHLIFKIDKRDLKVIILRNR